MRSGGLHRISTSHVCYSTIEDGTSRDAEHRLLRRSLLSARHTVPRLAYKYGFSCVDFQHTHEGPTPLFIA